MTALSIQPTFPTFTGADGQPLENGYIWIGTANLNPITNPITVYWDAALSAPATQPIRTLGGYPSNSGTPARMYVNSDYSIQVLDRKGSVVYSAPVATERYGGGIINAADVVYDPAGTGAVATTVQAKLRESVSVIDFIPVALHASVANGTNVTPLSSYIQAAINAVGSGYAGGVVNFPSGDYLLGTTGITIPTLVKLIGTGFDSVALRYSGTGTAVAVLGTIGTPVVKIGIHGMAIYGSAGSVYGIDMQYCPYVHASNLRVYGFQVGVSISDCWNCSFDDVLSENNTQDGFNISGADANAVLFTSCQAVSNGRAGVYISSGYAVKFVNCTFEINTQYGVYITATASIRPTAVSFDNCYIEGNGTFEVYSDAPTALVPIGLTFKDCYFEFLAGKAATAIRLVDASTVDIDGCAFDNRAGNYSYSLYMAAGGSLENIKWGNNSDTSTNGVYSEVYYINEQKLESCAWGRFTVSGAAIATQRGFGVSVAYISTGTYEVTLNEARSGTGYCIVANAENGASYTSMICSASPPSSSTVFRIAVTDSAGTAADARTVSFVVYD